MEAECEDYLSSMSGLLKGEMGFIMSNWADPRSIADIAPDGKCNAGVSCTAGSAFKSFAVNTSGSAEDPATDDNTDTTTDPTVDPVVDPTVDPVDPVNPVDPVDPVDPNDPGELITEVASYVGLCGADCAECEASYFENLPDDVTYTCNSEKLY